MSSGVVAVGVVADLIAVIAVSITLTRHSFSAPKRAALLTLSLLCAWFVSMVLETLRSPVWLLLMTGAVILLNVIALAATIHLATSVQPDDDPGDGHDGRGRPGPENPARDGGGGEPGWWPEFERQFADYVSGAADRCGIASARRSPRLPR